MLFPYSRVAYTAFCDLLQGGTLSYNDVRLLLGLPQVGLRPRACARVVLCSPYWSTLRRNREQLVVPALVALRFAAKNLGVVRLTLVVFHHNYPCPPVRLLASNLGGFRLARLSCRCHSYAVITALRRSVVGVK